MDKIKNPIGRALIHAALVLFSIYSIVPFYWTFLQSFKSFKDANSRTPKFFFTPTWENYQELWLRSVPENGALIAYIILMAVVILICLLLFAKYIPVRDGFIYAFVAVGFVALLWGIPKLVETAKFYDYFINTIIVTVGTVVVSITIGSLAAYGLARYAGLLGVILLVAALGFRALPRLAFILPYFWMGSAINLLDTHLLVILTMVAVNQPFTIWMLRSFFMEIPADLEEAAMIDGASRLTAFRKVIIPIMWPGIISTALFSLLLAYNEFLLVRVLTQTTWTLPVAISRYTGGEDPAHLTIAAAAAVSATIPIILVILFFQKNLVKGLASGAVKG
ncbi:MAG: carbohydrate ABC transporter permease [Anaerolineae bacterium]|jgi:ABC-type glycerol-3-phosphate transport system permease component|nr:carbohydrate ABC transporter permease [Anaerolineae bacterium]MBT7991321.1 carbohydrate ABC transporter permease [Anaerolineae bacterium]